MKLLIALLILAAAVPAPAQEFKFRGEFVETHLAEQGFLNRIPPGTKLNCDGLLCSSTGAVRIYVFRNRDTVKEFWSTDYYDVMFDEAANILSCGETGHVAHYDDSGQMLYRTCSNSSRASSAPAVAATRMASAPGALLTAP
jgi:hypothetical protein